MRTAASFFWVEETAEVQLRGQPSRFRKTLRNRVLLFLFAPRPDENCGRRDCYGKRNINVFAVRDLFTTRVWT